MVFLLNCAVYLTIKMTPHKCGKLITVSTLVGLSVFHIYRMIINYGSWSVDLSTVIMTIICKYSLFAYAVEDGHNKKKSLTPEQEQNKI